MIMIVQAHPQDFGGIVVLDHSLLVRNNIFGYQQETSPFNTQLVMRSKQLGAAGKAPFDTV